MTDLDRESKGLMKFLSRRMLENYLLSPAAIAEVLRSLGPKESSISADQVIAWIREHGEEQKYGAKGFNVFTGEWMSNVHAAKLLDDLFPRITGERHRYIKTEHASALAQVCFDQLSADLSELKGCVSRAIGVAPGA